MRDRTGALPSDDTPPTAALHAAVMAEDRDQVPADARQTCAACSGWAHDGDCPDGGAR